MSGVNILVVAAKDDYSERLVGLGNIRVVDEHNAVRVIRSIGDAYDAFIFDIGADCKDSAKLTALIRFASIEAPTKVKIVVTTSEAYLQQDFSRKLASTADYVFLQPCSRLAFRKGLELLVGNNNITLRIQDPAESLLYRVAEYINDIPVGEKYPKFLSNRKYCVNDLVFKLEEEFLFTTSKKVLLAGVSEMKHFPTLWPKMVGWQAEEHCKGDYFDIYLLNKTL